MLKSFREKVDNLTPEQKITCFCALAQEIDMTQKDIDMHLKERED